MGIPLTARVSDAVSNGDWIIRSSRSTRSSNLRSAICLIPPPQQSAGPDYFFWSDDYNTFRPFSSSFTWDNINEFGPIVPWHSVTWFTQSIPKHSFMFWLAVLNRLSTRDRVTRWIPNTPTSCLLCDSADESVNHIFFSCQYSSAIWHSYSARSTLQFPSQLSSIIPWSNSIPSHLHIIMKLLLQACVYNIWLERNKRLSQASSRPPSVITAIINRSLRAKLYILDRQTETSRPAAAHPSLIHRWFEYFHHNNQTQPLPLPP